ncbi:hypothetical protein KH5H1_67210 [Corallococcus caeni]|nr:hypothetical protein KH5H1_67210 [Corallococcus sp. KH5-1]
MKVKSGRAPSRGGGWERPCTSSCTATPMKPSDATAMPAQIQERRTGRERGADGDEGDSTDMVGTYGIGGGRTSGGHAGVGAGRMRGMRESGRRGTDGVRLEGTLGAC